VTALYEVVLTPQGSGPALTVAIRYADPRTGQAQELQSLLQRQEFGKDFAAAAPGLQLATAVAGFAERLQTSTGKRPDLAAVLAVAQGVAPRLANDPDVQEFIGLVEQAGSLGY
jgi:hypothetical protein